MSGIGRRLALAFFCVIIFMVAQGVIAYLTTNSLDELHQEITREEMFISDQQRALSQIRLAVYKLLGTMNPQEMDDGRRYFDANISLLSRHLIELDLPPELVERNRRLYREVIELQYKFMAKTARQLLNGQSKTVHGSLLIKLEDLARQKAAQNSALLNQAQRNALIIYGALLLAALIVASVWAVVLARNLTDRKRAERALKESEERYRLIFESSETMISVFDARGTCLMMNQNIAKLFGGSPDQFIGKSFADLHPSAMAEKYTNRVAKVIRTGEKGYSEDEVVFPQGNRWLLSSTYPVRDSNGKIYAAQIMSQDITARKNAESDKKRLEAQLRHAQKMEAVGTLAGGIAHDFNNILAAITGYSELALDDALSGRTAPKELRQVLKAADRAKELVQMILAFSRKAAFEPKPLDLNRVISDTLTIIERTIPKMISVKLRLDESLRLIKGDHNQIEQTLLNLTSNAQDAMPEGGKLIIETRNVLAGREHGREHADLPAGEYVLLTVSDTGKGMDPDTLERIFDPFYTTKDVGKGTGLGLASAYGIVKRHGGHIFCQSEPGQGTSFQIYLPTVESTMETQDAAKVVMDATPGGSETVLLVDDEESLREVCSRTLENKGYQVMTASSGEEALGIYGVKGDLVDLVIMDLGMPGMGGHKALKELVSMDPGVKVIIASGYALDGRLKDDVESGAAGYISKPFRRDDLLNTVREVLDRTAANQQGQHSQT